MTAPVVDARPLIEAIEAAVEAQGLPIGNGRKPAASPGDAYVIGWFGSGTITDRSLRSRDGFSLPVTFQVYGFDPDSIQWAIPRLRTAVLGLHGAVAGGRKLLMPVHSPGPDMDRDDDVDPPIFWQVDEWRFPTSAI